MILRCYKCGEKVILQEDEKTIDDIKEHLLDGYFHCPDCYILWKGG